MINISFYRIAFSHGRHEKIVVFSKHGVEMLIAETMGGHAREGIHHYLNHLFISSGKTGLYNIMRDPII
jgi:hypothetical protein